MIFVSLEEGIIYRWLTLFKSAAQRTLVNCIKLLLLFKTFCMSVGIESACPYSYSVFWNLLNWISAILYLAESTMLFKWNESVPFFSHCDRFNAASTPLFILLFSEECWFMLSLLVIESTVFLNSLCLC